MKNLKLLAAALLLACLINVDNSMASQEQPLPTEIPGRKKPPLPEKMLNSPEFQAFLKIYNEKGEKEEKLNLLDSTLLAPAREQALARCSRFGNTITEECIDARINVAVLELLRDHIKYDLTIDSFKQLFA